jgi:hypothetical protein
METAMIVARAIVATNVLLSIISLFLSRPETTKIYILLLNEGRKKSSVINAN